MNTIDCALLINMFNEMGDAIEQTKDELCVLDGVIGDADHGVTMSIGFTAVGKALAQLEPTATTPTDIFNTAAKSFLNAVGASAGPLYATAFMKAGAAVKGKPVLDTTDFAAVIVAMAEGIQFRGKAEAGDKTMLDAWLPAAQAAKACLQKGNSMEQLMMAVELASEEGANSTIDMLARKGRSAKLGERTIGHKDAGAASTAILISAIRNRFQQTENSA